MTASFGGGGAKEEVEAVEGGAAAEAETADEANWERELLELVLRGARRGRAEARRGPAWWRK